MTPQPEERKRNPGNYYFLKILGEGSYSTVYLAAEGESHNEFAIKVLNKRHIIKEKKMAYVNREKKSLLRLGHDTNFFVHLYATFQDSEHLYFVLTYAPNGELLHHILKHKSFELEWVRYYGAELLMALEFLKEKKVIHRDIKPENILFDKDWHIVITDFGSAKIVDDVSESNSDGLSERKNSFVGTAQYVSPEVLHGAGEESTYASDLWAFGCIIYQMLTGQTPFRGKSQYLIFLKITKLEYDFPDNFHTEAKHLVENLLILEPENRIGAKDSQPYVSIRNHKFFEPINWTDMGPPPKISETVERTKPLITSNHKLGFNEEIKTQLHLEWLSTPINEELFEENTESDPEPLTQPTPTRKKSEVNRNISDLSEDEIALRLQEQLSDPYNRFVEGNLILKKGFLEKKKCTFGFARRRMFLLTMGPRLFYVDPVNMVLKGEVPWSADMHTEAKSFKIFFIHTPNRVYYLEDTTGYALEWCKVIDDVIKHYYPTTEEAKSGSVSLVSSEANLSEIGSSNETKRKLFSLACIWKCKCRRKSERK